MPICPLISVCIVNIDEFIHVINYGAHKISVSFQWPEMKEKLRSRWYLRSSLTLCHLFFFVVIIDWWYIGRRSASVNCCPIRLGTNWWSVDSKWRCKSWTSEKGSHNWGNAEGGRRSQTASHQEGPSCRSLQGDYQTIAYSAKYDGT